MNTGAQAGSSFGLFADELQHQRTAMYFWPVLLSGAYFWTIHSTAHASKLECTKYHTKAVSEGQGYIPLIRKEAYFFPREKLEGLIKDPPYNQLHSIFPSSSYCHRFASVDPGPSGTYLHHSEYFCTMAHSTQILMKTLMIYLL